LPAAQLIALLLDAASIAAGSPHQRYAVPPPSLVHKLSRRHHAGDWLRVTTNSERLDVKARRLDAQGLHGLTVRNPRLPHPIDVEWERIARIDVITTQQTLGRVAGGLLGGIGAASTGDQGFMWGSVIGGLGGQLIGAGFTGERSFYVASPLPAPARVSTSDAPLEVTTSAPADSEKSVATASSVEPARSDADAAPVSAATPGGIRAEFGFGMNGLAGLGDFGKVSRPCVGGDAALLVEHRASGLGVRVAGGVHLLQGYTIPTGEVIFTGTGTQQLKFEAKQSLWWMAIGPAWTRTLWGGSLDTYVMAGRGIAKASSGQAWANTQGEDPGTTGLTIARVGTSWSPAGSPVDIGAELLMAGRAAFWDNPPATTDSAGNHVLRSRSATITGVVFRLGHTFGR
jgi:hypothetical protein